MSQNFVVLGASGFLGKAFIDQISKKAKLVKAVARHIPESLNSMQKGNVVWFSKDLLDPVALREVLTPDDIVINLAFMPDGGINQNINLIDYVITACIEKKVLRLVHCSTAVVVGNAQVSHVTESTRCMPQTSYETVKLKVEEHVLGSVSRGLDVAILRPTAIVGPGGKNLLKLFEALRGGKNILNYLRASLFGSRPMHLVPVNNVALALWHIALLPQRQDGNIYLISSDEDPDNNFGQVEKILLSHLGLSPRRFSPLKLPTGLLSFILKLLGRSDTNLHRFYDSKKLRNAGFIPVDSISKAVRDFCEEIPREK